MVATRTMASSHRVRVEVDDLNQNLNQGATYFAEAQYVTPHEYAWCQDHPGQCNMYNNVSYRQFMVSGTTNFNFSPVGNTIWRRPAISAWAGTGASLNQIEPDPGNDGIWFMGYKVTNPSPGVWHYEYALYNENLDRGIQSFSVPLGLALTSVTSASTLRHRSPVGQMTARKIIRVTAARRGLLLKTPARLLGALKRSRRIKTRTRFAGARCITSGSIAINRRKLAMQRSASLRQVRR